MKHLWTNYYGLAKLFLGVTLHRMFSLMNHFIQIEVV
jgi:hypothetical protein